MSERFKPKTLKRERMHLGVNHRDAPREAVPRDQIVYRDGQRVVLEPLRCRLHDEPWRTCTKCSAVKK